MSGSAAEALHVDVDRDGRGSGPLQALLEHCLRTGFPSGLSLAVTDSSRTVWSAHGGLACRVGTPQPIRESTLYDLASLTKVVCSASLAVVFERRGLLGFDGAVAEYLPGFPRHDVTILQLLTHTSGLHDRFFFEELSGRPAIEKAAFELARGSRPTGEVLYADVNFILLGWLLERVGGAGLDELFATEIALPLEMARSRFRPERREETAATELDGDQRLRPELVWGEVHDGNCHALGGVSGHAGLFAPLEDLVGFSRHLLSPDGRVFDGSALETLARRRAGELPDVRALGWRLAPEEWGDWPEDTLWHTGFTGTSMLISPSAGLAVVLLTNAIHPKRRTAEQAEMRALIHRLVSESFT